MLRVPPFRGDQVACGVVALTTLVVLLELRMRWGVGVHLGLCAAAIGGVALLLAGCPREARPYVSAIVVCLLVLEAVGLGRLGEVLGASRFLVAPGILAWALPAFGLSAVVLAVRYDAAAATLGAGLAAAFWPAMLVFWAFDAGIGLLRTLLVLVVVGLALGTVALRDRHAEHAAQLANAAGGGLLGIAAQPIVDRVFGALVGGGGSGLGWGWELCLVAGGFGLLAYGAVDRQRGPVILGLAVVLAFVGSAAVGDGGAPSDSLLGWPIVLALGAAFGLVVGLRPTTPAGPEPEDGPLADPPPPLPLR